MAPEPHRPAEPPDTLAIAREISAIARIGLHFSSDPYDTERYRRLEEISAHMLAGLSDVPVETIHSWSRADIGYATPKVDVRAFILEESRVFLIREDADGGRWTLPGGWADVNETPSRAIVREVEEESGLRVAPLRLLAVLDREKQGHKPPFPFSVYKMFFHCRIEGGSPARTLESSESGFFAIDALPELSTSRVLPCQILSLFEAVRSGRAEAAFD
jgi:ADP-ribose pyrophosphatase YjhB (NUDIX family)